MSALIVSFVLKALVILVIAKLLPGVRIKGFGSALAVAIVYAILSVALRWFLVFLSLPMIIVTFGFFLLVLNAFLLWMTDKLVDGVEFKSKTALFVAAILMTLGNMFVDGAIERWFHTAM